MNSRAIDVIRQFPGAMIGLPGNQRAISNEQFTDMLLAMQEHKVDPYGFHFLGIGEENRRFKKLVEMVHGTFPEAVITTDSSRANAYFGEGRAGTSVAGHITDARAREAMDDVTEMTGAVYRGDLGDFTTDELDVLVKAAGADGPNQLLEWITDKTLDEHAGDERIIDAALFQIAYTRGASTVDTVNVRTETIERLETKPTPERQATIDRLVAIAPATGQTRTDPEFRRYLQSLTDDELGRGSRALGSAKASCASHGRARQDRVATRDAPRSH